MENAGLKKRIEENKMEILELEKSLFEVKYMNDKEYLNNLIDDNYLEIGKSGKMINKDDVIKELSSLKENRNIDIYNFSCTQENNLFIVHYITVSNNNKIYRTSIWKKEKDYKILFHQASVLNEEIDLTKC